MTNEYLPTRIYPAKLLLFGEHVVLSGARALAVPHAPFFGQWQIAEAAKEGEKKVLQHLIVYLLEHCSDFLSKPKLKELAQSPFFFSSNIPYGSGLGSSGTLCAAIYDACKRTVVNNLPTLKQQLARMEGYFHGSSSGLDPLVSFLDRPVLILEDQSVEILPQSVPEGLFFLMDSGIPRTAAFQIKTFAQHLQAADFKFRVKNELVPLTEDCIHSLLTSRRDRFEISYKALSKLQLDLLGFLIPDTVQSYWAAGLQSGEYFLKLCGAGGGGYFMGIRQMSFDKVF